VYDPPFCDLLIVCPHHLEVVRHGDWVVNPGPPACRTKLLSCQANRHETCITSMRYRMLQRSCFVGCLQDGPGAQARVRAGDRSKTRSLQVVRTVGWLGSVPDLNEGTRRGPVMAEAVAG